MNEIKTSIKSNIDSLNRTKKRYQDLLKTVSPYIERIESIAEAHKATVLVISDQIVICKDLKSFRDCLPLLEALEAELNFDFDTTRDTDAYRIYSCSATKWIRVDGEVSIFDPDNPDTTLKCKRVPTGKFNTYPEYKLVCEE